MGSEKILTLHPEGKQGVKISRKKYELMKKTILTCLNAKEFTFKELGRLVKNELNGKFEGSINWYYTTIKLDLEARNIIERKNMSPQRIRVCIR